MTYFFLLLAITCSALVLTKEGVSNGSVEVSVRRNRKRGRILFEIQAQGLIRATPQQTWAVLTDYGRLSEFVPGLLSSKLLSRRGNEVVIEQQGSIGFVFVRQAIHLVVRVTEQPFSRLDVALLAGDMRHYASRWELAASPLDGGTRIAYRGSLEPDFFVPLLLGRAIVQADVQKMLAAVVAEVERRSGASR
ncbi:SRPBCC family protein [Herminiimonas sp. CN]|uniref:SRPBCC family protein n=1 Tax=Herminiimonas sp. CN TaxID=1349818 RepID=UPI00055597E5|nr:SRPBCC family protein [Herminiimonas sp. CN]